ncbi:MAG TPA: PTS sugar transporter subunit IIA [Pirellulales bacterium]|nr:PTS sugar transporter subunit IIA [Pirellulales bacterium]
MADNVYGPEQLADYLHMTAEQVLRLAERGKLPGRKVAGRWRFSEPEIHHWLEQRIGGSDELELARMEDAFGNAENPGAALQSISTLLTPAAIDTALPAKTRSSVIRAMVTLAEGTGWLWDTERMTEAINGREELYPTALDNGVALLHPRRPMPAILERPFIAFGRTSKRIPFGNPRGVQTDLFFLICSTSDRGHLHTLARLSRLIADDSVLAQLRTASDRQEAHAAIAERESQLEQ